MSTHQQQPGITLSPLELLEQRSRRLATKINEKAPTSKDQNKPPASSKSEHHESKDNGDNSNEINSNSDEDDTPSDNFHNILRRKISRKPSTASIASLGSILSSFRLSSIPVLDSNDLTPTTSRTSVAPSRNRHYSQQDITQDIYIQQPQSSQPRTSTSTLTGRNHDNTHHLSSPPLSSIQHQQQTSGHQSRRPHFPSFSSSKRSSTHSLIHPHTDIENNERSRLSLSPPPLQAPFYPETPSQNQRPVMPRSYNSTNSITTQSHYSPYGTSKLKASNSQVNISTNSVNYSSPVSSPPLNGISSSINLPKQRQTSASSSSSSSSSNTAKLTSSIPSKNKSQGHRTHSTGSLSNIDSHLHQHHSHPISEFDLLKEKSLNGVLTLEEHVTLGIYYHEEGNLRESSYHWQHAAFQGDMTAMLLYGLALRHGWGIRKNPEAAVSWLKKAIQPILNNYSLEDVLNDEDIAQKFEKYVESSLNNEPKNEKTAATVDPKNNHTEGGAALHSTNSNQLSSRMVVPHSDSGKVKKAQVALALYELGMCYVNDKEEDLALRCFELAGTLGDADALSEAAQLWMKNGPKGRKKDIQRAAKLYRMAADRGANVVANSWIYKDKYMKEENSKSKSSTKKKK